MVSFEIYTIHEHMPLNFHIIIGLLQVKISEIFKAIYALFPEILNKKSITAKKFPVH